jgi:hypothetical protein
MRARHGVDASLHGLRDVGAGFRTRQRDDGLDHGQCVLGAVVDLAGEQILPGDRRFER